MQPSNRQLIRGALAGIVLAFVVFVGLTIVGDLRELRSSLSRFNWLYVLPIAALTIWNYWWRFLKWEMYLEALDVPHIPRTTGLPIFLSGFSMSVTPGKVGEIIKAWYVRRETDAPIERVGGAIVAERATDAFAMLVIALVGATQYSYGRIFVIVILALSGAAVLAVRQPRLVNLAVGALHRIPVANRFAHLAESFLEATTHLLSRRLLLAGIAIGVVSWSGECVAFFLVLVGLGVDASWSLLLIATFVLAVSSLAGGVSMLPGGLGVADASVAAMLLVLIDEAAMTDAVAVAATLLIRFATLWFAVLLGVAMLLVLRRRSTVAPVGPLRNGQGN